MLRGAQTTGTIAGPATISGAGLTPLSLVSTDAGAAEGPILDLYRNSASPAANDVIGGIEYTGNSSTGVKRSYASVQTQIVTTTNAAEDGRLRLYSMVAGTLTLAMTVNQFGTVGMGAVGNSNIRLRLAGTGATTAHGLFVEDSGGNTNLDVLDNGAVILGRTAPATNVTAPFVYIPAMAGAPIGTPVTQAGFVPIQFDTSTSQFWVYTGGAWKQPKTPAAAALITWQ